MSDFEFIFVLYSLLLGLSLVELLGGLGRVIELRFAQHNAASIKIGYLTPALGAFVMLDLLSFWIFAWSVRNLLSVTPASLLAVMMFASCYYLAARLVFPSDPARLANIDDHYFRVRRLVLGLLIALVGVQWAYLLSIEVIRQALLTPFSVGMTLMLVALMIAAAVIRHPGWSLALLLTLSGRYLALYLAV
ncbi:MAG: hypothetical protein ACK4GD_11090 [Sphingomonadaceae bacterium]